MMILQQVVLHALCHTSQHTDNEWALATHRIQRIQTMVDFLFGIVADGTGVQEYGIGLVKLLGSLVASHLHDRGHHLGVGHIHLTAVSLNIEFLHKRV